MFAHLRSLDYVQFKVSSLTHTQRMQLNYKAQRYQQKHNDIKEG